MLPNASCTLWFSVVLESNGERKETEVQTSNYDEITNISSEIDQSLNEDVNNNLATTKFNWKKCIKRILREREDNEMSVRKLSKKLRSEYKSYNDSDDDMKDLVMNKINSYSKLVIENDRVKLKSWYIIFALFIRYAFVLNKKLKNPTLKWSLFYSALCTGSP